MNARHRLLLGLCFIATPALTPLLVHASGEVAAPSSTLGASSRPAASSAPVATAVPASALPELPRLAPIARPEPDVAAVRELDRILDELTSHDARARGDARAALAEPIPGVVDAIRLRVQDIRGSLDRDSAPRVLADARKQGRKALRGQKDDDAGDPTTSGNDGKKEGTRRKSAEEKSDRKVARDDKKDRKVARDDKKDREVARDDKKDREVGGKDEPEGDWLDFMLAMPRPNDSAWRDVVKLLAMERMLVAVGTTPAVRELIALHAYFGELLRIDLGRQIAKLQDKAVPALIEARQHDAKIVQRWANKQLDLLGRAIPGEAISTNDTQLLADVLRAYGRTRDVDAVRVILSFCNSDRARLRDAAREAISAVGEPALWQLRDAYLNLTGNKPPREWAWDRIARELFATYDRARLAEVYRLMDEGLAAAGEGKITEATDAFDKVLARSPLFERRKEMVPAYLERARSFGADGRDEALAMLRKALRLDPNGEQAKQIEADVAYLEGLLLAAQGTPDRFLFKRALELQPTHAGAREALAGLEASATERRPYTERYLAAGGVGVAALLAMLLIARRRGDAPPAAPPPAGPAMAPEGEATPASQASPREAERDA